nr:hypothetical protein [Bacilli bacterium]
MPKLGRVLILSASYGEGHQQAALAVQDALIGENPDVEVKIIDYMRMVHPIINSVARYCYLKSVRFAPALYGLFYKGTSRISPESLLQRRLNHLGYDDLAEFLDDYKPDVVLSTFPTPAGVMSLLKKRNLTTVPDATVITDHAIHSQWIHPYTDRYFVGSERVKKGLILRGIAEDRIQITGIPIRTNFLASMDRKTIRLKFGLDESMPTLLMMAGSSGNMGDAAQICELLFNSSTKMQVLVVCGRNEKLHKEIKAIATHTTNPVWVFGFTREVHELMAVSDLIITKAGGLTVSEALAMELPMLLYRPIPGQETQNASYLVRSRVAVFARNRNQVGAYVERLFRDNGARLQKMRANTVTIRKTTAALDIAKGLSTVYYHSTPTMMALTDDELVVKES